MARDSDATLAFCRRLAVDVPDGSASPDGVRHAELIAAGYEGRQLPYDTFWGARYAVVADPDGHDVGIMSPLDDRHRSWRPKQSPEP